MSKHPFDFNGLAPTTDFETPEWAALFARLEKRQAEFLRSEEQFRSKEYKWPRDSLHDWSRAWEYPFVFHHLELARRQSGEELWVVDVGSGVTFFPFAVADLGCRVTCTDIDPIAAHDLPRAASAAGESGKRVDFRLTDGVRLPFADGEVDVIYCVSVLEHIPNWEATVLEMRRVLKPGGLLLLTIDVDLIGTKELGPVAHRKLMDVLRTHFEAHGRDRTIHPNDVLRTDRGPYPLPEPGLTRLALFYAKQLLKPLFGRRPVRHFRTSLAVHGMAWKKPSTK